MRMNTIAAIPMRILLGVLFFLTFVGGWCGQQDEGGQQDVAQDEEQDENGGDGERKWFVILKFGIFPDEQGANDSW